MSVMGSRGDLVRVTAPACRWTFQIEPVRALLDFWCPSGQGWIDPFAGHSSRAEFRNDLDPESATEYHMEAQEFVELMARERRKFRGVLWDPPYSYRQISDCYSALGKKATMSDTNSSFYSRVRKPLVPLLRPDAVVIYCGWDTIPFAPDFEIVAGLDICHGGGHRNDTLVTVQRRMR